MTTTPQKWFTAFCKETVKVTRKGLPKYARLRLVEIVFPEPPNAEPPEKAEGEEDAVLVEYPSCKLLLMVDHEQWGNSESELEIQLRSEGIVLIKKGQELLDHDIFGYEVTPLELGERLVLE